MEVYFTASIKEGRFSTNDWEFPMEISDEEYQRLKKSARDHVRFVENELVSDIYEKAYNAMLNNELENMEADDIAERMANYLKISVEEAEERQFEASKIINMLKWEGSRSVGYPAEIEEALEKEEWEKEEEEE